MAACEELTSDLPNAKLCGKLLTPCAGDNDGTKFGTIVVTTELINPGGGILKDPTSGSIITCSSESQEMTFDDGTGCWCTCDLWLNAGPRGQALLPGGSFWRITIKEDGCTVPGFPVDICLDFRVLAQLEQTEANCGACFNICDLLPDPCRVNVAGQSTPTRAGVRPFEPAELNPILAGTTGVWEPAAPFAVGTPFPTSQVGWCGDNLDVLINSGITTPVNPQNCGYSQICLNIDGLRIEDGVVLFGAYNSITGELLPAVTTPAGPWLNNVSTPGPQIICWDLATTTDLSAIDFFAFGVGGSDGDPNTCDVIDLVSTTVF